MKLESGQSRIVKSKHLGYGLLGTGKTTAVIYRYLFKKLILYDCSIIY